MILEDFMAKVENELENEGLIYEDISEFEIEIDIKDLMQPKGILDAFSIEIDQQDMIIRIVMDLY